MVTYSLPRATTCGVAPVATDDFRILRERDFGNTGALIFSAADAPGIIVFHPKQRVLEWLEISDETLVNPLYQGPKLVAPPDEKTFVGNQTLSLLPNNVPGDREVRVLVLPVVEPGQRYDEPDLARLTTFNRHTSCKTTIPIT